MAALFFFYLGEEEMKPSAHSSQASSRGDEESAGRKEEKDLSQEDLPYKYKEICDQCNSKKCSQYDTLYGRQFKFGKEKISDDLLNQYNNYCKIKIEKFNCEASN
jgi:hypothetical protein